VFEPYGRTAQQPSLTIDILNKESLADTTKNLFGGELPAIFQRANPERLRGDFRKGDAVWGFRETSPHKTKDMSSAVVLAGEKVVIYIAPVGHGLGYLDLAQDGIVFAKTNLEITLFDVLRGVEKTVMFDNFESPPDDPSRYILWEPKERDLENEGLYGDYGFNGLYSIRIRETSSYYVRADWTEPLEFPNNTTPPINESWTQFAAYWWARALNECQYPVSPVRNVNVLQNAEFRTNIPINLLLPPTIQYAFDHNTDFPSFLRIVAGETLDLTDEQKEIVMRDSAMGLLLAQGPILLGDSGISPTIGIGITDKAPKPDDAKRPTTVRIADANEHQVNRLYGLDGIPAVTNLHQPLSDLVSNHNSTNFSFRNPVRVIESSSAGIGSKVLFSPTGLVVQWASSVGNTPDFRMSVTIGQHPGIEETDIESEEDALFQSSSSSVSSASSTSSSSASSPSSANSSLSSLNSGSSQSYVEPLYPMANVFVDQNNPTINYGGSPVLFLSPFSLALPHYSGRYETYLKFDTTLLTPSAFQLDLHVEVPPLWPAIAVWILSSGATGYDWEENVMTWNSQPLATDFAALGSAPLTSQYVSVPCASFGDYVQPDGTITLLVAVFSVFDDSCISSKESPIIVNRPRIMPI
jgi:hypothetical protein